MWRRAEDLPGSVERIIEDFGDAILEGDGWRGERAVLEAAVDENTRFGDSSSASESSWAFSLVPPTRSSERRSQPFSTARRKHRARSGEVVVYGIHWHARADENGEAGFLPARSSLTPRAVPDLIRYPSSPVSEARVAREPAWMNDRARAPAEQVLRPTPLTGESLELRPLSRLDCKLRVDREARVRPRQKRLSKRIGQPLRAMQASEEIAAEDFLEDDWVRRFERQGLFSSTPRSLGDDRVDGDANVVFNRTPRCVAGNVDVITDEKRWALVKYVKSMVVERGILDYIRRKPTDPC